MPSEINFLNRPFSHIYVEDKVASDKTAVSILKNFKNSTVIPVCHYKDVFTPYGQSLVLAKHSPSLILAKKEGRLIYEGAAVCEDFGNNHFYYTSLIMNCFYDCEYCYLGGMYPSANIVVFVNIEDIFNELDALLKLHPVYICISYDTDLLALEAVTGFIRAFINYSDGRKNLTVECRTKSANIGIIKKYIDEGLNIPDNFIFAWTLSPDEISKKYEHKAPDFESRLSSVKTALSMGLSVRLCFDPVLKFPSWETVYAEMINRTFSELPAHSLKDLSIGSFRVSKDFLSKMRKRREASALLNYPFTLENGVYSYGHEENKRLTEFLVARSAEFIDRAKIFTWD